MPLKILNYPWHEGHQWELYKLPYEFYWIKNKTKEWDVGTRPIPKNVHQLSGVRTKKYLERKYDLAILHLAFDILTLPGWGKSFFELYKLDMPKIIINHSTKFCDEKTAQKINKLVGKTPVVNNSFRAEKEWLFPNSRTIIHGFSPEDWPETKRIKNEILTTLHYPRLNPGYKGINLYDRATKGLPKVMLGWDTDRECHSFNEYRDFLQAYPIYFNPTKRSPNPRSRAEAMLSGLAIVTTKFQDADDFFEDGVNGFISNDWRKLRTNLQFLLENPKEAKKTGRRGRKDAQKIFHIKRYHKQWNELIEEVLG